LKTKNITPVGENLSPSCVKVPYTPTGLFKKYMPFQLVSLTDNPTTHNVVITGGLVPRGGYNAATTYAIGDFISYGSSSYVLYVLTAAGTVPTSKWQLVVQGV
jgi:hypothetical protein